jgi:hypothetical protein
MIPNGFLGKNNTLADKEIYCLHHHKRNIAKRKHAIIGPVKSLFIFLCFYDPFSLKEVF